MNMDDISQDRFISSGWNFLKTRIRPPAVDPESVLLHWRERILFFTLLSGVLLGFFAFIPSVALAYKEGLWWIIIIDTIVYIGAAGLLFLHRIPFVFRAGGVLFIVYTLGVTFFIFFGPFAGGPVWLFTFPILTGVLLGLQPAIVALLINILTLVIAGFLLKLGIADWSTAVVYISEKMTMVTINFIFLNAVATIALAVLVESLKRSVDKEKWTNIEMKENQKLLEQTNVQLKLEIEERKQAEKDKTKLETQLWQAQKMEAIGTLAGGIAHDFNNILSSVIGYTELSLDAARRDNDQFDNLKQVLIAGNRAKDLVKQILTFSRQTKHEIQPISVDPIVKEVSKMLRSTIPTTIDMDLNIRVAKSTISGDATQIHQIIMNLCTNAVHAMEAEGGRLLIGLADVQIDEGFDGLNSDFSTGNYLKLTISDTGVGIPTEFLERIFDPYFTTKQKGKGTGMGLSVVHGIVKSHKGHITVTSRPQEGTTFDVYLPLIEKGREQVDMMPDEELPRGSERVLFVDDEIQIVNLQTRVLAKLGYGITARSSSLEALEAFRANPNAFDVVITDLTMPKMTGERLAQEIKKIRPDIPIILCTGYSERFSEENPAKLGVDVFLMKPVGKADLAKALRKVLGDP